MLHADVFWYMSSTFTSGHYSLQEQNSDFQGRISENPYQAIKEKLHVPVCSHGCVCVLGRWGRGCGGGGGQRGGGGLRGCAGGGGNRGAGRAGCCGGRRRALCQAAVSDEAQSQLHGWTKRHDDLLHLGKNTVRCLWWRSAAWHRPLSQETKF